MLGLATGSTPIGIYRELIRLHRDQSLDWSRVVTFNLDEYYPMAPDSLHSYRRFMWENLFEHVNVDPRNVHIPRGDLPRDQVEAHCREYERAIAAAGGIDFQILGIGQTGHVGFNEPGSSADSRTRLVTLDTLTRRVAAADFFGTENVPTEAVTMGVATILEAREIALLATGEHKAAIVRRAVEGDLDRAVAATYLQRHPHATFWLDAAAAAELTRIKTPWLVQELDWTPALATQAVVWLSETTAKSILKLDEVDYREHHLSGLLARYESAWTLNGIVFNALTAKVRGRGKLPSGERIVVFSPHPDDDVISAGGVLLKLRQNHNHIVVAYQTSGNIAVFDHEVRRYLDFLRRTAQDFGYGNDRLEPLLAEAETMLSRKRPAKSTARPCSSSSDASVKWRRSRRSRPWGWVRSRPASSTCPSTRPARCARIRSASTMWRSCASCSRSCGRASCWSPAISPIRTAPIACARRRWRRHSSGWTASAPEIWYYRGAWQEWSVPEADLLIPLSEEELRIKIAAIFKHQSQKDRAPFPGVDEREFWQRVEERNKSTAQAVDRLRLPEYYAMEALVVRPASRAALAASRA